jgi:hypothetical protein
MGVACIRESRNLYKVLIGKPKDKRPLGRSSHGRENNIEMVVKGLGWMILAAST